MIKKQVNIQLRYQPIPIAVLIKAANSFDCEIFIKNGASKIDVKNYDALKRGLPTQNKMIFFYFDGKDETAAEDKIEKLFEP